MSVESKCGSEFRIIRGWKRRFQIKRSSVMWQVLPKFFEAFRHLSDVGQEMQTKQVLESSRWFAFVTRGEGQGRAVES